MLTMLPHGAREGLQMQITVKCYVKLIIEQKETDKIEKASYQQYIETLALFGTLQTITHM